MPADLRDILRIEVPVIVQIASRTMRLREVMSLTPGAIIELPKLADEELEVMVSNKQVGLGRAVKVGENFGIRISRIGDVRSRIQALGGRNGDVAHEPGAHDRVSGAGHDRVGGTGTDRDRPGAANADRASAAGLERPGSAGSDRGAGATSALPSRGASAGADRSAPPGAASGAA